MKTMYVDDETEPLVCLFAFRPRLMAPPTTKRGAQSANELESSRYIVYRCRIAERHGEKGTYYIELAQFVQV
jgi:hypothetical protein